VFGPSLMSARRATGQSGYKRANVGGEPFFCIVSFVSFRQINLVLPPGLTAGVATVTVANSTGKSASMDVTIGSVAPALFTADSSGSGAPGANALIIAADGSSVTAPEYSCVIPVTCLPAAVSLATRTQVYLTLYGTGIRGRSALSALSAKIAGTPASVTYAGPQGT
jgi:uncharacterized protein (TIGR03437 family)